MVKSEDGSYVKKSSEELKPGDIIQIQTSKTLKGVETKKRSYFESLNEIKKVVPLGDKLPPHLLLRFLPSEEE